MRTLTDHKLNEVNESIEITADARDEQYGNASHLYTLAWTTDEENGIGQYVNIRFQRGPVKEVGVNGITNEALIAVVMDRLRGFQAGPFACRENASALKSLSMALDTLHSRTKDRLSRNVEGTNER